MLKDHLVNTNKYISRWSAQKQRMLFSHDDLLVYFLNKQTYRLFDRELNITVNIPISKVSILRTMQIENSKKNEGNNQDNEISEQRLQSQRKEENAEYT